MVLKINYTQYKIIQLKRVILNLCIQWMVSHKRQRLNWPLFTQLFWVQVRSMHSVWYDVDAATVPNNFVLFLQQFSFYSNQKFENTWHSWNSIVRCLVGRDLFQNNFTWYLLIVWIKKQNKILRIISVFLLKF